jgi:hypothetical protein
MLKNVKKCKIYKNSRSLIYKSKEWFKSSHIHVRAVDMLRVRKHTYECICTV